MKQNVNSTVMKLSKIIWDYLKMDHELVKSDCLVVFGCHDDSVAEYAAKLYKMHLASNIIITGGFGKFTKNKQKITEAEWFAEIITSLNIPKENILIENKSSNIRENILNIKSLFRAQSVDFHKFILVCKPYAERRIYATFKKLYPRNKILMSSPKISFKKYIESYPKNEILREDIIALIVGELNRIKVLPSKSMQINQKIPKKVQNAYEQLVSLGFSKYLWK